MALQRIKTRKTSNNNWSALDVLLEGCQIVDFELRCIYVNKVAAAQGQKTREELVGHKITEAYPGIEQNKAFLYIKKSLKNRTACKLENKFILPDGNHRWLELSIEPVPEGILILSRDVSENKNLLETIEKSKALLQAVLDSSPDWMYVQDINHRFLLVNKTFSNSYGLDPKSIVGKYDTDILPEEFCKGNPETGLPGLREHDDLVFSGNDVHDTDHLINLPDSSSRVLDLYKIPLKDARANVYAALSYVRDITEQRLAEKKLTKSYEKVQHTLLSIVEFMGTIVEKRDPYTAGHQRRVTDLACNIAREIGLSDNKIEQIHIGGMLHDIGKIYIPAEILSKPGKLNESEFNIVKHHSQMGYEIVNKIEFPSLVAKMVLQHHERLNGSGYPYGIHEKEISLEAKIIAVADVVEAMSSHRPYRPALGTDLALTEIVENKCKLYDSDVVDTCVKLFHQKGFKFKSDTHSF